MASSAIDLWLLGAGGSCLIDTRIGKLDFELGVPTPQTATKPYDEMDFQRAVQSYLWGLSIVGMEQNRQGLVHDTSAKSGDLALYNDFRSKSTTLAANNNTPYTAGSSTSRKGARSWWITRQV